MGRSPNRGSVDLNGLLLVNKPSGMTSHDVVHQVRKHFDLSKVGHGGTLDPMATGLLVLLLGKGTKLSQWVMSNDKTYAGEITLGVRTYTQDAEGEIISERDPSGVTREQLDAAFGRWLGDVEQIPPMVSAIKKGGKALYKMAREGETIEREPRAITIHEMTVHSFTPPRATFSLRCTKGTYVRTICDDVGEDLGCGGHLSALSRTGSGDFRLENALPLDQILALDIAGLKAATLPLTQLPTPTS